jgi:hypothetical protein
MAIKKAINSLLVISWRLDDVWSFVLATRLDVVSWPGEA